jgi:hippurate hydrolase
MKVLEAESTPPTYNNPELTRRFARAVEAALGKENVVTREPLMVGEDFGRFGRTAEKIPICIFWLGAVSPERIRESQKDVGKPLPTLHSSVFAPVPEPTIKTGVRVMTTAALELLGRK